MRRIPVALLSVACLVALAACGSDNATTSPRGITAQSPLADVIPACSFSTMNQAAKQYFPNKDVVFDLISTMKTTFNKSGRAAATPAGFDVLARVEAARAAGVEIGTGAAGGIFVDDVVGCMDVGDVPSTFNAGASLTSGVFAVRGNDPGAAAALANNASPNTAATLASPLWGAEPGPGNDWTRSSTVAPYGRYLVYGYPLSGGVTANGFELGTLPATVGGSTDQLFRVGLCVSQIGSSTTANRLNHLGTLLTGINTTKQGASFCVGNMASAASKVWYRALASRVLSVLAPSVVSAQFDDGSVDGIGGLPSGWSPFKFAPIAGSGVALTFGPLPVAAVDSVPFQLVVHASTSTFANVPGVSVALSVANNSGTPASAVLIPNNPVAVTDANGDATFTIAIGKPGGYTITAVGTLSGSIQTPPFTSNLFNVKN